MLLKEILKYEMRLSPEKRLLPGDGSSLQTVMNCLFTDTARDHVAQLKDISLVAARTVVGVLSYSEFSRGTVSGAPCWLASTWRTEQGRTVLSVGSDACTLSVSPSVLLLLVLHLQDTEVTCEGNASWSAFVPSVLYRHC